MTNRQAVYAGTFDPPTVGHLWMIEQGAALFNQLVVAIGDNVTKRCLFSTADRMTMLREAVAGFRNVQVESFTNQFLITYARSLGVQYILRGIRSESDYEYERAMRYINSDLDSTITTVFLMPPRGIAEVSSSMVKNLVGPDGWEAVVRQYVPSGVFQRLQDIHGSARRS